MFSEWDCVDKVFTQSERGLVEEEKQKKKLLCGFWLWMFSLTLVLVSPDPGWFPESFAATNRLRQELSETSPIGALHRTREGFPEEEGPSLHSQTLATD